MEASITINGGAVGFINTGVIENVGTIIGVVGAPAVARLRPRRTIVVGDLHGDVEGLRRLLARIGAINVITGARTDPERDTIIQIGDLIHGGRNRADSDDTEMLRRVGAMGWFDHLILGNHDAPHVYPRAKLPRFGGMTDLGTEAVGYLYQLREAGKFTIALAHEGYLLTHAGLHPRYLRGLVEQADWGNPQAIAAGLVDLFARRIQTTGEAPVIDDIGPRRGGYSTEAGGVLWCDWQELVGGDEQPSVPLIVGHTPYYDGDEQRGVVWGVGRDEARDIWRVDSGSALSGVVCCIVQDAPGLPFYPVTYSHREG